jgi:CRP-like cAMP-binding protein
MVQQTAAQEKNARVLELQRVAGDILRRSKPNSRTEYQVNKLMEYFKEVGAFAEVPSLELGRICNALIWRTYNNQEMIFKQGETGRHAYFLFRGKVSLQAEEPEAEREKKRRSTMSIGGQPGGKRRSSSGVRGGLVVSGEVAILRANAFFGEVSLHIGVPRSLSAYAIGYVEMCLISEMSYHENLRQQLASRYEYQQKLALLSEVEIFRGWPRMQLVRLAYTLRLRTFHASQVITRRGDALTNLYFIDSGDVALQAVAELPNNKSHGGKPADDVKGRNGGVELVHLIVETARVSRGSIIGDMFVLDEKPVHLMNAVAKGGVTAYEVSIADFKRMALNVPGVKARLAESVALRKEFERQRVSKQIAKVVDWVKEEAEEKSASPALPHLQRASTSCEALGIERQASVATFHLVNKPPSQRASTTLVGLFGSHLRHDFMKEKQQQEVPAHIRALEEKRGSFNGGAPAKASKNELQHLNQDVSVHVEDKRQRYVARKLWSKRSMSRAGGALDKGELGAGSHQRPSSALAASASQGSLIVSDRVQRIGAMATEASAGRTAQSELLSALHRSSSAGLIGRQGLVDLRKCQDARRTFGDYRRSQVDRLGACVEGSATQALASPSIIAITTKALAEVGLVPTTSASWTERRSQSQKSRVLVPAASPIRARGRGNGRSALQ